MPCEYAISVERRFVHTRCSAVLTFEEALTHQNKLLKDPVFDPAFSQLIDGMEVTRVLMTTDEVQTLASRNVFGSQSKRAFVAPDAATFGIARMLQAFREAHGAEEEMLVTRDMEAALEWLNLDTAGAPF
jgi:hypothetical protein